MTPQEWYGLEFRDDRVLRITEPFVDAYYSANLYFLTGREYDLLVDAGMGIVPLKPVLPLTPGKPVIALATHIHIDHVGALHEFEHRAGPASEAALFATMPDAATFAADYRSLPEPVTRLPSHGWRTENYRLIGAPLTRRLSEGDRLDLGDRVFEVLELPGHSPCIALFDQRDGLLFSGDAIYDEQLLDDMPCSDVEAYCTTMERLIRDIDPRIVYGGHGEPFDGNRMREIARGYLTLKRG